MENKTYDKFWGNIYKIVWTQIQKLRQHIVQIIQIMETNKNKIGIK